MRRREQNPFASLCLMVGICLFLSLSHGAARAQEAGFKKYSDPGHRFSFDYPATMHAQTVGKDEVKVLHPGATLRITVVAEKRSSNQKLDVKPLLEAMKSELAKEKTDFSILKEGKHHSSDDDTQGYVVYAFKDVRGRLWVHLLQCFLTKDFSLKLTISDRAEGFKDILKVIAKVHESFEVSAPKRK